MSSELARLIIQKYLNEYFLNLNSETLTLSVILFINLIKIFQIWSGYLNCSNLKINPNNNKLIKKVKI